MTNPPISYTRFLAESQILSYPNLSFRMYYLEAPISILGKETPTSLSNKLLSPNLYHTGIGFQSTDKGDPVEFTFDYELVTGFSFNAILPKIVDGKIIWNNETEVLIGSFIDRSYWLKSTYIGTITNTDLVKMQKYILESWNPANPIYSLFRGCLPSPTDLQSTLPSRETIFNPYMRGSTCDDFCYSVFDYLISIGVCIEYVVPPMTNMNCLVAPEENAREVDYEQESGLILIWYSLLEENLADIYDLYNQIDEILAEIKVAPPDEIPALVERLIVLFIEVLFKLGEIFIQYEYMYYYGYHKDGSVGYWRYDSPSIFINYIQSNLLRSFSALNTSGQTVMDGYTASDQPCRELGVYNSTYVTSSGGSYLWIPLLVFFIIIAIVIIIIIVRDPADGKRK